MGKIHRIFCAGFGGQGVMSMGQLLAYGGLRAGKEVTWCPSYGPEMRGGEANCSVIISGEPVGAPLIRGDATAAVFMNIAAFRKFMDQVEPGGKIFVNSTLIREKVTRDDVKAFYLPVSCMAEELGDGRLANIIMLGALNEAEKVMDTEYIEAAFQDVFGKSGKNRAEENRKALKAGAEAADMYMKNGNSPG